MLIVLMGGSCAGKDTLQELINKKYNIPICISSTTRPIRENEKNGREYYFLSEDKFLEDFHNGKFIEHRTYGTTSGTWYYGLSKNSVDVKTNQLVIVDQQGYYSLIEEYGQENVLGIYLFAPERVKIQRALARETRTDDEFFLEFYRRMADDLVAFNKCKEDKNVNKIENISLEKAVSNVIGILALRGVIE